jgi:hypothetical protein
MRLQWGPSMGTPRRRRACVRNRLQLNPQMKVVAPSKVEIFESWLIRRQSYGRAATNSRLWLRREVALLKGTDFIVIIVIASFPFISLDFSMTIAWRPSSCSSSWGPPPLSDSALCGHCGRFRCSYGHPGAGRVAFEGERTDCALGRSAT